MPDIIWKGKSSLFTAGVNTVLVEQPDSPEFNYGEVPTCTRKYKGLHSLCKSSALYSGTLGTGDMDGWTVKSSKVTRAPRQIGLLEVQWQMTGAIGSGGGEGGGGELQLPQDEYGLQPFDINPKIERHSIYADFDEEQWAEVRAVVDGTISDDRERFVASLTPLQTALVEKLHRGQENYYLAGWTYSWSTHHWDVPTLSAGGFLETPGGPLAGYLGSGIHWLRQADSLEFNGTTNKRTMTWIGGPVGHWDTDFYTTV
jgi:hypothetical protein